MTAGGRTVPLDRGDAGPGPRITASPARRSLSPRDAIRVATLAIAGSWLGYFLFTDMPALTFEVFPATLTLHLVVVGGMAVYVAALVIMRRLPGGTPLDLPVVGLLLAYGLATYASVDWRASLEPVLLLGAAVAAFYLLSDFPFLDARSLRVAFMLTCGGLAVFALWVVGGDYADYLRLTNSVEGIDAGNIFPPTVPRVHGVSDHPNVLAMVLVLAMPFYAMSAFKPGTAWERWLGLAGLFVAGWAVFLTLSRGGWMGVTIGVVFALVGGWLTVRAYAGEAEGRPLTWESFVPAGFSPTALAAILGALALFVFGALAFLGSSSTRPGWLFRGSLSAREDAWDAGLEIFRDNPLTGSGPNTFALLYPQVSEHAAQFIEHTQHAHNGFLQAATDAGLIGLAALAAVSIAAAFMLWRAWRGGSLEGRLTAVACGGALAGFAVHQLVDAGNIWKAPPFALACVGAILARNYREVAPEDHAEAGETAMATGWRVASLAARVVLPLLLVPLLLGWWRVDSAHRDYWRGLTAWNEGDVGGLRGLQDAVDADSSMMVYQLQLGVAQATAWDRGGQVDDELLDAARIHLERAAEIDPRSDLATGNLARVYEMLGRDDDAAELAMVTRLADHHVTSVLVAGEVLEDLGRDEDAISAYGQVISMDGGLANSTFWEMTTWRQEHYAEILQASTIGINPCVYGSFLVEARRFGGYEADDAAMERARDECRFLIFTSGLGNDLPSRVALARMELTLGEREEALGHLRYAIDRQPDFGPAHTEMGIWHGEGDDLEAARAEWVTGGELDEGESLRRLGDTYPEGEVPEQVRARLEDLVATTGSSVRNDLVSILYYRMRFGRLSPVFALIPRTWQDAVPRPYAEWVAALERWGEP